MSRTTTIPLSKAQAILFRAYAFHVEDVGLVWHSEVDRDPEAPAGSFFALEMPESSGVGTLYLTEERNQQVAVTYGDRLVLSGLTSRGHSHEVVVLPLMAHFVSTPEDSQS